MQIDGRCRSCGSVVGLVVDGPGPWVDMGQPCPNEPTHNLMIDVVGVEGGGPAAPELPLELERSPLPGLTVGEPETVQIAPAAPAAIGSMAELLGLDLASLTGTGPDGSITFEDLERAYQANRGTDAGG